MKKRLIALILSFAMVISTMPTSVFAENSSEEELTTETSYLVSFEANGADVCDLPEWQVVKAGEMAAMPSSPSREGYLFLGWYEDPDETSYGEVFDFANTPITRNTTLYAGWADPDADDDQDGLPNSIEEQIGTEGKNADTDHDGLSDYLEMIYVSTDPLKEDSDGDGVCDYDEDYDGDGIANGTEAENGTKPGSADSDYDGLSDREELDIGSDPLCEDTDGDGAADGLEVQYGYKPLLADASFTDKASSQPISADFPVSAMVLAEVSAELLGSVALNPLTQMDNPLISKNIPGYLGNAFALTAGGELGNATLSFQYDTETWELGETFQPRIYRFDEETQELQELSEQWVTESDVTAIVDSCGTYILLNKCEYEVMTGSSEIALFDAAGTVQGAYAEYYAAYEDELRALASNGDTTDNNHDKIYDKYNMYIYLGLIPTVTGACSFVGYDFSQSDDWDGDTVLNGDEIKIEIHDGLPRIKVLSYPMFRDSDFDGWDDAKERSSTRKSDPMRHSYYDDYVDSLLNDDLYAAALLVEQIESKWYKQGALDFLTFLGYVQYGSLENTFTREWLTYLVNYYDNQSGEILEDSAMKYQREYWASSGMAIWETAAKYTIDEMGDLTADLIAEMIQNPNTAILKEAKPELARLITLRDTAVVSYFHGLGEDWDIDGQVYAEQLDSMATTMVDYDPDIERLTVEVKHAETVNMAVDVTMMTIDILGLLMDEAKDLKEVYELISQISANLEAYASSSEIFLHIYQNHPEEKARNAAWTIYQDLQSSEETLNLKYLQTCESFGQVGVGTIIVALENVLKFNPFLSAITKIVANTVTAIANLNNLIIADDILCDAVEDLTVDNLQKVGFSYSPYDQEEKPLTDRYLANLIQLRILGEMKMNNYIRTEDSQTRHDSNVEKLKGYAESFNIPLSAALLIQCAVTTTPNVIITNVKEYVHSTVAPPAGDFVGYSWRETTAFQVTIDGFTVTGASGINLTPGDHVIGIGTQYTKPCFFYITVAEDGTVGGSSTYALSVDLVPDLTDEHIITGSVRDGSTGETMEAAAVTIREGFYNKKGSAVTSFETIEGEEYAVALSNGYYTFAFSKDGYETRYANISVYDDATLDATLYEVYELVDGTITYVASDATNVPSAQWNTVGETVLTSVVPVKNGYVFVGWSEMEGDRTTVYAPGAQLPAEKAGNITLYAIWDAGVFDIVFHANGGIFKNANSDTIIKQKTYLEPFLIDVEVPQKDGCEFAGVWALNNGTTTYKHGNSYSDIGSAGLSAKHLYAVWKTTEANILYDYGDDPTGANVTLVNEKIDISAGNVSYTIKDAEAVQTFNGNTFKGWICQDQSGALWWANAWADNGPYTLYKPEDQIQLNGDMVLYAKWTYFLHYDHGNGQFMHTEVGDEGLHTVVEPVYDNGEKIFQHWTYVNADGETVTCMPGDQISVESDLYLTAVWTDASHLVSGTVADGTVDGANYGNPIEGVIVAFYDETGACVGATMTDSAGVYTFDFPEMGTYSRTFIKGGYTSVTVESLVVSESSADLGVVTINEGDTPLTTDSGMCGDLVVWMLDDEGLLTIIGAGAMYDFDTYTGGPWCAYENSISKVVICDGITTIGDYAFSGLWGGYIESFTLSKDLVSIGKRAFYQVRYLWEVTLPETLERIEYGAFENSGLTSITIPKNVKEIGYFGENYVNNLSNPFASCYNLAEIQVDVNNLHFRAKDGVLYTKDMTVLVAYPEGKENDTLVIPEGVEKVVSEAFGSLNYTRKLKHVSIPSTLPSLSAFNNVPLESFETATAHPTYCSVDGVVFSKDQKILVLYPSANPTIRYQVPEGIEEIDSGAFTYCNNLITLDLPSSLTKLDYGAIQLCDLICNLVIPENVVYLGSHALSQCNSLTDVYFMGNLPTKFYSEAIYHYPSYNIKPTLYYIGGKEGWTTPTCTADGSTYNTQIFDPETLDLRVAASGMCTDSIAWEISQDGVLTISGTGAIPDYDILSRPWSKYSEAIQKVVVKEGITAIGQSSFDQFAAMTEADIANSVETIGTSAFNACHKLTTLSLPSSLQTIGNSAFSTCENLTGITFPGKLKTIGNRAFGWCDGLTGLVLPNSVQSIGEDAFYYCENLISVDLPDDLETLAGGMFAGCTRLRTVTLPDKLTAIGSEAFRNCDALISITMPNTVESIGEEAFYSCEKLASVQLPDRLQTIGAEAFSNCSSITSIAIPDAVTAIGDSTFTSCSALQSISLPEALQSIGARAFSSCTSLTSISIPDSVEVIGQRAFYGCVGLTEISLPESLSAISDNMLYRCENLQSVIIPASVNSIGRTAFYGCDSLTELYFKGDVPETWGFDGLWNVCDNVTIYYVEGTEGWTSPTWTSPNRDVFKTAVWGGEGTRPITAATRSSTKQVVCTVDAAMNDFAQMIVGAYDAEDGKFLGAAMGTYNGSTNTITVAFDIELPENAELRVFCTDESFVPQYKVSCF